jgi:chromosome segregation ATPase
MNFQDAVDWVVSHWESILGFLGVGGGGHAIGKKLADKKHDTEIKTLKEQFNEISKKFDDVNQEVKTLEKDINSLNRDVAINTAYDKQFREQMEKQHSGFREDLKEVKGSLQQILNHLLNS